MLRVLEAMQGMDGQRRVPPNAPHLLYESRAFRTAFMLSHDISSLFGPVLRACEAGDACALDRLAEMEARLGEWASAPGRTAELGRVYSLHYALSRTWAALVARLPGAELWRRRAPEELLCVARFAASVFAFCDQITRGLWVRNDSIGMRTQLQWFAARYWWVAAAADAPD
jgi:hypothetical protein